MTNDKINGFKMKFSDEGDNRKYSNFSLENNYETLPFSPIIWILFQKQCFKRVILWNNPMLGKDSC